jgi:hypothetical protein
LYSTDGTLTQQNVFDFQTSDQSITKYYANLRAFPHMRQVDQQREISQQFAKGVDNHFIKLELIKSFAKNPQIDLLSLALKIQKDIRDSIQDYSNSRNAIEVNHIAQNQAHKTPITLHLVVPDNIILSTIPCNNSYSFYKRSKK